VDQQHVGVAILAQGDGLPGAHGDDLDLDIVLILKARQQVIQQPRVLGAGGGGQDEFGRFLRWGRFGWLGHLGRRRSGGLRHLGRFRGAAAASQDADQQHQNTQQAPTFFRHHFLFSPLVF
jgi:hypothetical protein